MKCKKCGSSNVKIEMATYSKRQGKGFSYWFLFGWMLDLFCWLFLTLPRLLFAVVGVGKRNKVVSKKVHICQDCGKVW